MTGWSPQQEKALREVAAWAADRRAPQVFRLFGYAGTGKTTLARAIADDAGGAVLFGAFTGKAAHVLHKKGCTGAATIHSMIYSVEDDGTDQPRFVLNRESGVKDASLVIIDEVSMVGEDLGRDLLSFGTKVLVLGDPAQLPPVKSEGFFTNCAPDLMLTEVHRQAKDSPIIAMATAIREGGRLQRGVFGGSRVISKADVTPDDVMDADQVIVGMNRTRHTYNARMRTLLGYQGERPVVGDKLVCLKNDRLKKLLNGSIWTVEDTKRENGKDRAANVTRLRALPEDATESARAVNIKVKNEFWSGGESDLAWEDKKGTDEFTYGYALTCHKSQGSQWENVTVFDESAAFRDDAKRWLYTALTRAADRVTVVQ